MSIKNNSAMNSGMFAIAATINPARAHRGSCMNPAAVRNDTTSTAIADNRAANSCTGFPTWRGSICGVGIVVMHPPE